MGKRELIDRELERLPETDLDKLLTFLKRMKEKHSDAAMPGKAAESVFAREWLGPEEDASWSDL